MTMSLATMRIVLALATGALAADGVVQFDLTRTLKHPSGLDLAERFARRANGYDEVDLENQFSFYSTSLLVGSGKQNVTVQVDTGSSDLWIMSSSNPYCSSVSNQPFNSQNSDDSSSSSDDSQDKIQCYSEFTFDSSKSSSFHQNSTDFSIVYGDSTFANGSYCTDNIALGSSTIQNANFALASRANSSQAVFGIGLITTEASLKSIQPNGQPGEGAYSNLPVQMKEQGLISSIAYSLWLNDINSDTGNILFGGVDHAKYTGSLQTVPLVSSSPSISAPLDLTVMLNGLSVYDNQNHSEQVAQFSFPFLLDSGTTFTRMPEQFLQPVLDSIGAEYSSRIGYYIVECGGPLTGGGVTFDFSGVNVNVPFSEVLIPVAVDRRSGQEICVVGIIPDNSGNAILGDTFLRSAYVVYDLENKEVGLANVVYNATSANVESIGASGIPSATQAPSYSSTTPATTYSTGVATIFQNNVGSEVTSGFGSDISGGSPIATQPLETHTGFSSLGAETSISGATSVETSPSKTKGSGKNGANRSTPLAGMLGALVSSLLFFI